MTPASGTLDLVRCANLARIYGAVTALRDVTCAARPGMHPRTSINGIRTALAPALQRLAMSAQFFSFRALNQMQQRPCGASITSRK